MLPQRPAASHDICMGLAPDTSWLWRWASLRLTLGRGFPKSLGLERVICPIPHSLLKSAEPRACLPVLLPLAGGSSVPSAP